jgi:hypothetical protein
LLAGSDEKYKPTLKTNFQHTSGLETISPPPPKKKKKIFFLIDEKPIFTNHVPFMPLF